MAGVAHNQVLKKIYSNSNQVTLLIVTHLDGYLNTRQLVSQLNYAKFGEGGQLQQQIKLFIEEIYSNLTFNYLKKSFVIT